MIGPRSYVVESDGWTYRRNRRHLRSAPQLESLPVAKAAAETQQSVPQTDPLLLTKPAADPVEPAPSTLVARSAGRVIKRLLALLNTDEHFYRFCYAKRTVLSVSFLLQRRRCYANRHVTRTTCKVSCSFFEGPNAIKVAQASFNT